MNSATSEVDLTPEVVCSCACGRYHTREAFEALPLTTSDANPDGRLRHNGEVYEFRTCECDSTVAVKL